MTAAVRAARLGLGVLLAALGTAAQAQASPAPSPATSPPAAATAAPGAERGTDRAYSLDRKDIRAQLFPRRFTTLAAEIGARIQLLSVQEGSSFRAGQLLVRLDCSMQKAQADKARAELEGANASLQVNDRLAQLNNIGQLELDLSRSAATKARAELASQQALLGKCDITAPFAGRVAEQKAREQQYVQPGQALLDIIEDSVLELEFLAPSHWLAWLRVGQTFQVAIDETGKTYSARFTRLGARIDPVSQSVKVVGTIEGRHTELMAGMTGRVTVTPPNTSARTSR